MPILNYTTTVTVAKTVGEIQEMLARAGAKRIMIDYEAGQPAAITFEVAGEAYMLPCRAEGVYQRISANKAIKPYLRTREQANRVAWRIVKDWTEAQLAIIEAGLVTLDEVMLPYAMIWPGRSMYQIYTEQRADRLLGDDKGR